MNVTNIIGNLTRDPEAREVGGKAVCNFSVAVNDGRSKDGASQTTYYNVSAWNKTGEACAKFLKKGRKVYVSGRVSAHAYVDKDGKPAASLQIMANEVEFLSPASETSIASSAQPSKPRAMPTYDNTPIEVEEESLPW